MDGIWGFIKSDGEKQIGERKWFHEYRNKEWVETTIMTKFCKAFCYFPELIDGQDSEDPKQGTADMTIFVQNLLQQMQSRFQTMSESIVSKIDEMGGRINELEQSISDLRTEIGAEGSPSPLPPSKRQMKQSQRKVLHSIISLFKVNVI